MSPLSIIEHLVLFKVGATTDPSKIAGMVSSLRSLSSLPLAAHLAAGPIRSLRQFNGSPAPDFTHLLHARFLSSPDLAAYAAHPSHLAVVRQNAPITEDVLAVDWAADLDADCVAPPPGSGMRFLIGKPREGVPAAEILEAVDGVGGVGKVSRGVNFSRGRAKGFEVGLILGFSRAEEMEGAEGEEAMAAVEKEIGDLVETVLVVDFVGL